MTAWLEVDELSEDFCTDDIMSILRTRQSLGLPNLSLTARKMICHGDGGPGMYSSEASKYFVEHGFKASVSYTHVYGMASNAYRMMFLEGCDQELFVWYLDTLVFLCN